ncbi:SLATT domain-containing protein [Idiomarina zobellii]|nr:SLATT domain-containing protein [Idiomarina zobellii]SDG33692.1 hypothetical protein SAMN04515658_1243 [Idiomarina zobellii]
MNESNRVLEAQLRECYGRVVYSHKTHEKCADILVDKLKQIKFWQIVLSAILTGGLMTALFDFSVLSEYESYGTFAAVFISTILLVLNSYTKDYDLGEIAQKHRQAGADLWVIRESYLSLLTDLKMDADTVDEIRCRRDELIEKSHAVYTGSPITNDRAYIKAQKALKQLEDMTFAEAEIDAFLPKELKRKNTC